MLFPPAPTPVPFHLPSGLHPDVSSSETVHHQGGEVGNAAEGLEGETSLSPSQRIRASSVAWGLHYFGMSVSGGLDFNGDGLADITVGSRDRAAVLR